MRREGRTRRAGQVFDREKIYERIWGYDAEGSSDILKEHIRRIRAKLARVTDREYIETVWVRLQMGKLRDMTLRKTFYLIVSATAGIVLLLSAVSVRACSRIHDRITLSHAFLMNAAVVEHGDGGYYIMDTGPESMGDAEDAENAPVEFIGRWDSAAAAAISLRRYGSDSLCCGQTRRPIVVSGRIIDLDGYW